MELRDIETFLSVARTQKFALAAEELYCAEPTISVRIKRLEGELGTRLFSRGPGGGGVRLTESGMAFFPYADKIFALVEESRRQISANVRAQAGSITVAVTHYCSIYHLPLYLSMLRSSYPSMQVNVMILPATQLPKNVAEGMADFGLTHSQVIDAAFGVIDVARETFVLCTYPEHPLARRPFVKLEDLADEPLIYYHRESTTGSVLSRAFDRHGIKPHVAVEVNTAINSVEFIKEMVAQKFGVAIVTQRAFGSAAQDRLVSVPIADDALTERKVRIIYNKGAPRAQTVAMLAEVAKKYRAV